MFPVTMYIILRIFCSTLLIFVTGMLACAPCRAQGGVESGRSTNSGQVNFFNGDRISGRIEEITKDSIRIDTKAMGEVTVSLYTVKEVTTNGRRLVIDSGGGSPASSSIKTGYITELSGGGTPALNTDSRPTAHSPGPSSIGVSERPTSDPQSLTCNTQVLDSKLKLRPSLWTLGITTTPGET